VTTVALVGSFDTKGREYKFVISCLDQLNINTITVDFGILNDPDFKPDFSAELVAKTAGKNLNDLRFSREGSDTRAVALSTMESGVKIILQKLVEEDRIDAIFGMGGSGGSSVISGAMRSLPIGFPKLLLSTMASGDVSGYIGTKDLCIMYSVTDIAGLNRVSRMILKSAASAIAGMAKGVNLDELLSDKPLIAITMFGITTPGVLVLLELLELNDFETIVFHATGSGGLAMEEMILDGLIDGVIDYTVSELTDEYLGGIFSAGPHRLEAAGKMGIPQVIVPGALEVLNFGARHTLPQKYDTPERKCIVHNQNVCAVRINKLESIELGRILAEKINLTRGLAAIMIPYKGLDNYEKQPNGPWIDPDADEALFNSIKSMIRDDIPVYEIDANVNDKVFAEATFRVFAELWEEFEKLKG